MIGNEDPDGNVSRGRLEQASCVDGRHGGEAASDANRRRRKPGRSVTAFAAPRRYDGPCPNVTWVSGTMGTYSRTNDRGKTWSVGTVPDADKLDFRAVKAFGADTAYLLSTGLGDAVWAIPALTASFP
jgi:photosystem II stability/assembly factor-like uncharacterized protein